jgi:hypothetical protein
VSCLRAPYRNFRAVLELQCMLPVQLTLTKTESVWPINHSENLIQKSTALCPLDLFCSVLVFFFVFYFFKTEGTHQASSNITSYQFNVFQILSILFTFNTDYCDNFSFIRVAHCCTLHQEKKENEIPLHF